MELTDTLWDTQAAPYNDASMVNKNNMSQIKMEQTSRSRHNVKQSRAIERTKQKNWEVDTPFVVCFINNFLDYGEKSIETDKIQTSIPLALLNLQYTSVKVIMPPSSFIKKSNENLYVASLVSYHSLKQYWSNRQNMYAIARQFQVIFTSI